MHVSGNLLAGKPLISYLRYNQPLTENDLHGLGLDVPVTPELVESLAEMSNAKNRHLLYEIGQKAAEREIQAGHFS